MTLAGRGAPRSPWRSPRVGRAGVLRTGRKLIATRRPPPLSDETSVRCARWVTSLMPRPRLPPLIGPRTSPPAKSRTTTCRASPSTVASSASLGWLLGAAAVLDARRARLADGEADVTGGLAVDLEVLAEAADRASSSGDVRWYGGQKQVESRGHAGYIPAAPCANPEPLDRGTPVESPPGADAFAPVSFP